MLLLEIFIAVISLAIFAEDMLSQAVHIILFPILLLLLVVIKVIQGYQMQFILTDACWNIAFLIVQLILLTAYLSLRKLRLVNITKGLLNWGDILMLIVLCFYFSFLNYLVFYILSLIITLIIWIAVSGFKKGLSKHIPLAGMQAACFALLFAISCFLRTFKLTEDDLLIRLLS